MDWDCLRTPLEMCFFCFSLCPSTVEGKHAQLQLTSDLLCSTEINPVLILTLNCCTPLFSPTGPIITSHIWESGLRLGSLTWMTSLTIKLTFPWENHFDPTRLWFKKKLCLERKTCPRNKFSDFLFITNLFFKSSTKKKWDMNIQHSKTALEHSPKHLK